MEGEFIHIEEKNLNPLLTSGDRSLLLGAVRCPRCEQSFYQAADTCPHCGFQHADADELYGYDPILLSKLTDVAGILRMKDREVIRKELKQFEKKFPQLFFAIYAQAFENGSSLRQYGFWLLNHASFEDVDLERSNDCGILLTIDVNAKSLGITYGYSLQPYLNEESTFEILSHAHPALLEGKWAEALTIIIQKVSLHLKKKHHEVMKNPEAMLSECGQRLPQKEEESQPTPEKLKILSEEKECLE